MSVATMQFPVVRTFASTSAAAKRKLDPAHVRLQRRQRKSAYRSLIDELTKATRQKAPEKPPKAPKPAFLATNRLIAANLFQKNLAADEERRVASRSKAILEAEAAKAREQEAAQKVETAEESSHAPQSESVTFGDYAPVQSLGSMVGNQDRLMRTMQVLSGSAPSKAREMPLQAAQAPKTDRLNNRISTILPETYGELYEGAETTRKKWEVTKAWLGTSIPNKVTIRTIASTIGSKTWAADLESLAETVYADIQRALFTGDFYDVAQYEIDDRFLSALVDFRKDQLDVPAGSSFAISDVKAKVIQATEAAEPKTTADKFVHAAVRVQSMQSLTMPGVAEYAEKVPVVEYYFFENCIGETVDDKPLWLLRSKMVPTRRIADFTDIDLVQGSS